MQIQVTYHGQKYELPKSGLADMVAFERQFGVSSSVLGSEGGDNRLEYVLFLAYRGLRKLGVQVGSFDDAFLDALDDFEVEGTEEANEEADPTVPAPAPGS